MIDASQELQDCVGRDVSSLRLRIVSRLGNHDDISVQRRSDPVGFRARVLEVWVLLSHDDQRCCRDLGEPGLSRSMVRTRGQRERLGVSRTADARYHQRAVLIEVGGAPARVQLGEVCLPGDGGPRSRHRHAKEDALQSTLLGVAHERAHQHEAAHQVGALRRGDYRGSGAHGVPDNDRRALELPDQGEEVACGLDVTVGGKRRIAVAVSAKVGARYSVADSAEPGGEKTIRGSQVTHAGHQHQQRSIAADVVADSPSGNGEVDSARVVGHDACPAC